MASARLTDKRWFIREWVVDCDGIRHAIRYNGREFLRESVYVDGAVASQRTGRGAMRRGYHFMLDETNQVALSIAMPWWCEILPLRDLSFVRLELNGAILYEEGHPPKQPLKWTGATPRAFEVRNVHPPRDASP
jgi:hypothetical protein